MADDDFDMEPVVPRARKKKKKGGALKVGLIVLLILLVLIGVGAWGAWYFWLSEWYGSDAEGDVPVIHADTTPIKVKPKDPGGMAVPDRDKLVYNRMNGEGAPATGMERLLPPAEEPQPVPAVIAPTAPTAPMNSQTAPQVTPQPAPAAQPAPQVAQQVAPAAPTASAIPAIPKAPVAEKKGAPVSLAPKPLQTAPAATAEPVKPKTVAPPSSLKATPKPPMPRASASKGYRVQLGAVRSQDGAQKEWKRLKAKHKDVLGSLVLSVIRADLGAKGIYYRLRAGPLASRAAADTACQVLKGRKVPCFPVAPSK